MTRAVAVALVLASCFPEPYRSPGTKRPPRRTDGIALPGVIWETPRRPWQMREVVTALAVSPNATTAIVGGAQGWVAMLDLASGEVTHELRLGDAFTLYDFARLADGRWIAVGNDADAGTRAFALAAGTLAPSEIHLGVQPDRHAIHAGVAVTADGNVIIAGKGLPLAIYDPATWTVKEVLAGELGWNKPRVAGTTLAVLLAGTMYRFDLAAPGRPHAALGSGATTNAIAPRVVLEVFEDGDWFAEVWERGQRLARIAEPLRGVAITDDGKRVVGAHRRADGSVVLAAFDAPFTGDPSVAIDLGPAAASGVVGITLDRDRALVSTGTLVRVVDLAAKTVTPASAGPWSRPVDLGLAPDGSALVIADDVAWFLDRKTGATTATVPLSHDDHAIAAPDGAALFAVRRGATFAVFDRTGATRATYALPSDHATAWLGATSQRLVVRSADLTNLMTSLSSTSAGAANKLTPGLQYGTTARLLAVDPETSDVLLATEGTVLVADMRVRRAISHGLVTLYVPGCADEDASGALEPGGTRAATFAGRDVALWDRKTGALLGTQRFAAEVKHAIMTPGVPEVVVELPAQIALWDPEDGVRALPVRDLAMVRADATHVALAFLDGRVALLDRAKVRAAARPVARARIVPPKRCREAPDPFTNPSELHAVDPVGAPP